MKNDFIIDSLDVHSPFLIRDYLYNELLPVFKKNRPVIFLCIGSDRSTGDSLGPLIGDKLKFMAQKEIYIYGTLENPVHAENLEKILNQITNQFKNPFIVSIDACLGSIQNVGKIYIQKNPLSPGKALYKNLPSVGNLSILGVVNISGNIEFMILQNTRLYTVMTLAEIILIGINHCILKAFGARKKTINTEIENIFF